MYDMTPISHQEMSDDELLAAETAALDAPDLLRPIRLEIVARALEQMDPGRFDMKTGLMTSDLDEMVEHACGTAGCIAGTTWLVMLTRLPKGERWGIIRNDYPFSRTGLGWYIDWERMAPAVADWLGLPYDRGRSLGHDLFDPNILRADGISYAASATATEAAEACRRVARGEAPWAF